MHKVTKDTPHGTVELRAENVDALAYVIESVTMRYDMAAALRALQTVDRLNVAEWSAAMRAVDAALAKANGH